MTHTAHAAALYDGFWNGALPNALKTTSTVSPYFQTFLAAQVKTEARGFLSRHISVKDMQEHSGDIHHVVPKDHLKKHGFPDRSDYNQVGNFALTETSINIAISNRAPRDYMAEADEQIRTGVLTLGEIIDRDDISRNLRENALPQTLGEVTAVTYPEFLASRRKLMAAKIREYYERLWASSRPWQSARVCTLLRQFRLLRSVMVMCRCLSSTWNVSWKGALDNPSASSATSVIPCFIRARARAARSRASVNGRSAVRSRSPAPRPEEVKALCVSVRGTNAIGCLVWRRSGYGHGRWRPSR